jgi:hypothetical protein
VFSGRKIQQRIAEDIAFRVLAAGNEPDFRTISDLRKIHLETLKGFFEQVLKIALAAGAMKVGRVALDGTKIKANASKHKAMSYDRMKEQELQRRETRLKRIREAKQAVEERAQEKAQAEGKPGKEAKPEDKAQYNFTDPESRIMKARKDSCRPTTRRRRWNRYCS